MKYGRFITEKKGIIMAGKNEFGHGEAMVRRDKECVISISGEEWFNYSIVRIQ